MKVPILLAAATLVVGLAVGYVLGSSQTSDAPRTDTPPAAAPTPAPTADPAPAERRAPSRHAATKDAVDLSTIDVAVPPTTGDGVITGAVVSADGKPVAGVLVRATVVGDDDSDDVAPKRARGAAPPPTDVEAAVRRLVRALRRAEANRREATTDASGAYSLTGLGASAYQVEAWLVGWEIERSSGRTWTPVAVGGRCDFKAKQIHAVTASVLLPDGKPAQAATISWKQAGDDEEDSAVWKADAPQIEVGPGTYEFTAFADPPSVGGSNESELTITYVGRHRRSGRSDAESLWKSDPQTITIEAGAAQTLTFQLKGRPGVFVRVSYASAEHPNAVRIAALRLDGGAAADPAKLLGDGRVKSRWLTGAAEGAISGLEPGTYLVGATFRGGVVGPTATVSVGSDTVVQELKVTTPDLRDWIKVWLRGPSGDPVADATFEVGCNGPDGSGSGETEAAREADGSYRVEHYEQEGPGYYRSSSFSGTSLGAGKRTYFVRVTSKRFGTAEATYDPTKDREATIELAAPTLVRATIAGYAESPDKDRLVVVLEPKERGSGRPRSEEPQGVIDAQGVAKFPPVKPGTWDVVLRLAKSESEREKRMARWNGTEVARVTQTFGAGEASVSLALVALSELVVTFDGDAPRLERVKADGSTDSVGRGRAEGGDKRVTFQGLSAGRYRLSSDAGEMPIDVQGPATVAFAPRPYNAYHLQVSERGYVHDLGVRTGDLVIAIEGVEFTDRASMDAALAASKTRESSKFTLLRGTQRFDVTADGKRFEEDDGSWYRPWAR